MRIMRRLLLLVLMAAAVWGVVEVFTPTVSAIDCSIVRCPGCPDGYVFKPTGSNCCRCVPIKH